MIKNAHVLLKSMVLLHYLGKRRSQGMVEYALVMVFIVILVAIIYTVDFRSQIKEIFDSVVAAFAK